MVAMTLPTFLGIGVPRAGTTWLHTLLAGHPAIFLPTKRKEIRFFDRHFEHGLGWYESFFCPPEEADRYAAIGEISPQYFYCEECPGRIAATLPDVRLLVMLRHPVDRAYSNYGFVVQRRNYRDSFERFLESRPNAVEMGFYSAHLGDYLRTFGQDRILALVFERAVKDTEGVRRTLGAFLGVPPEGFPDSVGKVNASTVPRHGKLANLAVKTGRTLRRNHLESVVDVGARLGGRRLIGRGSALPKLDPDRKRELSRRYEGEFDELERLTGLDLSVWRS
jgi:Sulfotransferase domain